MRILRRCYLLVWVATVPTIMLSACDSSDQDGTPVYGQDKPGGFEPSGDYLESHHFNGVGKTAAVIVSTIHSSPVAGSSPTWKIRVVDLEGVPVDNAAIEIRASGPSSRADDLIIITSASGEGDGYYLADSLVLNEAGEWLLDVNVSWEDQNDYKHADNVDIEVSIRPASP